MDARTWAKETLIGEVMRISIKSNVDKVTKRLAKTHAKQVPFATSVALNETANYVAKVQRKVAQSTFDRPTPFLLNGIHTGRGRGWAGQRATKRNLVAVLMPGSRRGNISEAGQRVNDTLKRQILGGTRQAPGRALPVPTKKVRLNKYGNLTKGQIARLLSKPNVVSLGRREGVEPGIYRRDKKGRLTMLVAWEPQTQYRARFDYYGIAQRIAGRRFQKEFRKSMARAVATAR